MRTGKGLIPPKGTTPESALTPSLGCDWDRGTQAAGKPRQRAGRGLAKSCCERLQGVGGRCVILSPACSLTLANLLTMRPVGVVSKKLMGTRRMLLSSCWCSNREAWMAPWAVRMIPTSRKAAGHRHRQVSTELCGPGPRPPSLQGIQGPFGARAAPPQHNGRPQPGWLPQPRSSGAASPHRGILEPWGWKGPTEVTASPALPDAGSALSKSA